MENNTEKSQVEKLTSQNEHTISTTGLSLETYDNKHGATHMVAPGPIADTGLYHRLNYHDEGTSFDIKQYLSRPTYVSGGNFIDGSTAAIYIGSPTPTDITNNLKNTQGVYGVRATVCYRLEIAAAPQAQGIIRMAYEYMPPAGSLSKASYRPVLAQLPGAEVNLRSGSAIEVKVPFVYDRDYWPVLNGGYSVNNVIHKISIFPYAPVDWDTTTVSTPTWTLYRWFEDVEFISKTAVLLAVTPQAGMGPEAKHGKVSTWFKYASQISLYAGSIPSLSSIALPVSWAFDAATKIAAHFGWSKPNDGSYMGTMGMSIGRGLNTCADADFANPMGFYANNEVAALPGFAGNDFDEMALCYITCKPGLVASCVLKASDPRLAIKWTCPVTPSAFVFQSSTGGFSQVSCMGLGLNGADGANKPGYFPTPMCFAASFFERWRGDVIFRFKFGTTKFHAGKLLIGYVPGEDQWDGTSVGGLNEAPANGIRFDYHSAIVDLRTTDEYDFVVPYTYPASYCDTGMHDYLSAPGPIPNTGVVFVRLIDPLYGPDNVPQNIVMLVEVLSQCGLELAQPITSIVAPLNPTVSNVVVAQSGGMNNDLSDNNAAVHTTGERILSLKQLAARPYWYTLSTFNNSFPAIPGSNLVYYNPVKWFARTLDYNFPTIDNDTVVSRLGCLFALQRGGLIVRAVPAVGVTGVTKSNWYTFFNWARDGVRTITNSALSLEWNMTNQVRIPYYGKNTRMRTGWSTMTNAPADKNATTRTLCVLPSMSADVSSFLVGVAGADDFQLGAFTGVPPCVTLEPNNGGSIFAEQFLVRDA